MLWVVLRGGILRLLDVPFHVHRFESLLLEWVISTVLVLLELNTLLVE